MIATLLPTEFTLYFYTYGPLRIHSLHVSLDEEYILGSFSGLVFFDEQYEPRRKLLLAGNISSSGKEEDSVADNVRKEKCFGRISPELEK